MENKEMEEKGMEENDIKERVRKLFTKIAKSGED